MKGQSRGAEALTAASLSGRAIACAGLALVTSLPALAEGAAPDAPAATDASTASDSFSVDFSVEAGVQMVVEANSFWNLAAVFAPGSGFDPDVSWGEFYVKPGVRIAGPADGTFAVRAGGSVVASASLGTDVFASRNEEGVTIEDAYAGIRLGRPGRGVQLDLSVGAQPFRIGSGMLIADGGVDGFERGALIFGPRQAWAMTAIASLSISKVSLNLFHLDPRELKSGDTRTRINGVKAEYALGPGRKVGVAFLHVPKSDAPYVQAAPGGNGAPAILFGGRDGLRVFHVYGDVAPLPTEAPGLTVAFDYARQWNDRINLKASGGRFEIANTFQRAPWMPTIAYGYQSFSGDDPRTTRLERFDPLFYDGSPGGWATGSNGSFVFINSNVHAHRFRLGLLPSQRDIVTLRYSRVGANRLRSPIQFGQATRPSLDPGAPGIVAGVTDSHLSDDILIEYTRVLTPSLFATVGFAHSWSGKGLDRLSFARATNWTGGFVNLVARY